MFTRSAGAAFPHLVTAGRSRRSAFTMHGAMFDLRIGRGIEDRIVERGGVDQFENEIADGAAVAPGHARETQSSKVAVVVDPDVESFRVTAVPPAWSIVEHLVIRLATIRSGSIGLLERLRSAGA